MLTLNQNIIRTQHPLRGCRAAMLPDAARAMLPRAYATRHKLYSAVYMFTGIRDDECALLCASERY